MALLIPLTMSLNTGGSSTVFGKERHATSNLCMSLETVRLCFRSSETRHSPRKPHLVLLFHEVRAIGDDNDVSSWEHHYCTFNKMADRLANIAMDTGASIQAHAISHPDLVQEASDFLDSDVNHWLETTQAE